MLGTQKGRAEARPSFRRNKVQNKVQKQPVQQDKPNLAANLQRPKPVVCIAFREMSAVDAIPCIRSLNSSAFEALSSAVS
jgi:hypothetical protein